MLEDYRKNFNARGFATRLRYNEDLRNELIQETSFLPNTVTLSERMYYWFHNIDSPLLCPHCGKPRKFRKFTYGYFPTCGSKECRAKSIAYGNKFMHNYDVIQKKMKETYASAHNGISHNMKDPEFIKKYISDKKLNTVKRYLKKFNYSIIDKRENSYDIQCNKCKRIFKNIDGDLITYNLYRNKQFCENCYNAKKSYTVRSKFENDIYQYTLNICDEYEKIISNRKVGNEFFIYDIVLYDKKLVIECNGIYYHSELFISNDYHYKKLNNANNAGYELLTIWQDDWTNNKEVEKRKILRYINPHVISFNICSIKDNKFYYNNFVILELIINKTIITLDYKSTYIICDLYDYLKSYYNGYIIEHNLDMPLFNFEKQLEVVKYEDLVYYLDGHIRVQKYKEDLPKIYSAGKLYLKI